MRCVPLLALMTPKMVNAARGRSDGPQSEDQCEDSERDGGRNGFARVLQATVGWRSVDSVVVPAVGRGAMLQRHTHCPVAGHPFALGRCYAKPLKAMKTRDPSMRQEEQVLNSSDVGPEPTRNIPSV
jgi:hypothetical protein